MSSEIPWYYPPGWDRERMLNADDEESESLTQEQLEIFHKGLRADLGEAELEEFQMECVKRWRQRERDKNAAAGVRDARNPPSYLELMARATQNFGREWPQWGFVVFRTTSYEDQGSWQAMRQRWDQMIDDEFQDDLDVPGVREAKHKLRFCWVEDPKLQGASPARIAT